MQPNRSMNSRWVRLPRCSAGQTVTGARQFAQKADGNSWPNISVCNHAERSAGKRLANHSAGEKNSTASIFHATPVAALRVGLCWSSLGPIRAADHHPVGSVAKRGHSRKSKWTLHEALSRRSIALLAQQSSLLDTLGGRQTLSEQGEGRRVVNGRTSCGERRNKTARRRA